MKRTLVLLATLLLSFGLVSAQDSINVAFDPAPATGDTLYVGQPYTLEFWTSATSERLSAFTTGFHMYSSDGATWTWGEGIFEITYTYDPTCPCIVVDTVMAHLVAVTGAAMSPPGDVWDMQPLGLTINNDPVDFDGASPDIFMLGGVANDEPLCPTHSWSHTMSMFVTFGGVVTDEYANFCLDTIKVGAAGDFLFVKEQAGNTVPGAWLAGTQCWTIMVMRNAPPVFDTQCPTANTPVDHCGSATVRLFSSDFEGDALSWSASTTGAGAVALAENPGGGYVDVTYTPGNPTDVNTTVSVIVTVNDPSHDPGPNTCEVLFDVTNNAPSIVCPANFAVGYDTPVSVFAVGSDVDACDALQYTMVTADGAVNLTTGEFTWTPPITKAGFNTVTIEVSDGYATAQCSFEIEVLITVPFEIVIEKTHGTLQGHFVDVGIDQIAGSEDMGGFDFLIGYDNSALTFIEATPGQMLIDCGWEYFTYRYSWNGNCGNACPSGLLRVVGIAEINDGPNHPICTVAGVMPPARNLVNLKFLVTNDRTFECMYVPIRFYWMDCGDNAISSVGGDTLFISKAVYMYTGGPVFNPGDMDDLPGIYGAPDICMIGDKVEPIRFIYFTHGGVDIICGEDIDARGDINANGVDNEIADAVMLTNYFITGLAAFGDHVEASIAASDVNADGTTLSVADLVYLIRVIIGDANPYPKPLPGAVSNISVQAGVVSYNASYPAGAGLFVFDINGDFDAPVLLADGMDMTYGVNNDQLRVLVYNIGSNAIQSGDVISVNGDVELVEVEMADYDGFAMETAVHHLPSTFALAQNYPNPFNPKTTIQLSLPQASEWTLTVFNVAGQKVKSFNGSAQAGVLDIVWDGTDNYGSSVASGIYFYKATANNFSQTMKMVLMK